MKAKENYGPLGFGLFMLLSLTAVLVFCAVQLTPERSKAEAGHAPAHMSWQFSITVGDGIGRVVAPFDNAQVCNEIRKEFDSNMRRTSSCWSYSGGK